MKYIFLSYINRSGSTYLANLLSKSEEICVCPEAEIIYELLLVEPFEGLSKKKAVRFNKKLQNDKKFKVWKITSKQLIREGKSGFENFLEILNLFQSEQYPNARFILFKHNNLIDIQTKFESPNFICINLLRDPRAIFSSQLLTISPFTAKPMSNNVLSFIDCWNIFMKKVLISEKQKSAITIRYEDLLAHLDEILETLTILLQLRTKWNVVKDNPAQLVKWISADYNLIHRHINDLPQNNSLDKWKLQLNKIDLAILQNNAINTQFYADILFLDRPLYYYPYIVFLKIKRKYFYLKAKIPKQLKNIVNA